MSGQPDDITKYRPPTDERPNQPTMVWLYLTIGGARARQAPAVEEQRGEAGLEPDLDSTPEKFRRALESDIAHWAPVTNAIGLKID